MEAHFGKKLPAFIFAIAALFCCSGFLQAQKAPGITFLRMPVGSRAQAMGDAYTAVAASANGIHYNPAGMGFGLNRELMFFHSKWIQDISLENITFLYPFNNRWSIGSSVSFLHMPELTRYEIDPLTGGPLENGTFSMYDLVFLTGIGFRITDNIALGINLKFFEERIESISARGFAFDVGFLTRLPYSGISFGFSMQHLGPPVKYEVQKESLPVTYRAGLSYQFNDLALIAFDVSKTAGQKIQYLPGLEIGLTNSFYLRGGYQVANYEGSGITAGFGLRLMDNHQINYVYVPYGDLGDTHRAELILNLGSVSTGTPANNGFGDYSKSDEKAKTILNDTSQPKKHSQTIAEEVVPLQTKTLTTTGKPANLAPPEGLKIEKLSNNRIRISWDQISLPGVAYHIYAKPSGGSKWIKITPEPIRETYKIFTRKKSDINLVFVVTSLLGKEESDFPHPVYLQLP